MHKTRCWVSGWWRISSKEKWSSALIRAKSFWICWDMSCESQIVNIFCNCHHRFKFIRWKCQACTNYIWDLPLVNCNTVTKWKIYFYLKIYTAAMWEFSAYSNVCRESAKLHSSCSFFPHSATSWLSQSHETQATTKCHGRGSMKIWGCDSANSNYTFHDYAQKIQSMDWLKKAFPHETLVHCWTHVSMMMTKKSFVCSWQTKC